MEQYLEECAEVFLKDQGKLFDEPVAETIEEAKEFLEDCFAQVFENISEVRAYLDEEGMDVSGVSDEELADELEIPVDKISDTMKVSGRHISVDAPFVEGEDNSLLDVLVNDDSPMADRSLVNESLSKEIDRALSTLTEREKDIIQMFFGINTQEMTLEEIGDKFGLTRERVRQIKEKAIRRLRQNSRSKLLKSYLG